MDASTYIEERLNGQQQWYSAKSSLNKKYHTQLKISTIVLSVLIPFISGLEKQLPEEAPILLLLAILGSLVAVLTAISGLMKFKEKWINYRTASERLKKERLFWATKTGPYAQHMEGFDLLVKRVESIISSENGDWGSYMGEGIPVP